MEGKREENSLNLVRKEKERENKTKQLRIYRRKHMHASIHSVIQSLQLTVEVSLTSPLPSPIVNVTKKVKEEQAVDE